MDPPYVEKESGTYTFSAEEYNKFFEIIKKWKGPVIYTDVFSDEKIQNLGNNWDYKIIRETMGSGKPGMQHKEKVKEAIYTNFKLKKAIKLF
jgi:hypothetical protein